MYTKKQMQNDILFSLSSEISRIRGKNDMLHLIRNSLKQYVDFDDSFIMQYCKDTRTCKSYIFHAEKKRLKNPEFNQQLQIEFSVEDDDVTDLVTPVVQDVASLLSAGNDQVSYMHHTGIKKFITLKLIEGNEMIGLLVLLSGKNNSFTEDALDLLKKITPQISIATANIIINEEIEKREEEKKLLFSLTNEIAALKSREDLFRVVNDKIKQLLSVKEFGIAQVDEGGETYSAFALEFTDKTRGFKDFDPVTSAKYNVKDPVFTKVMAAEDPVLFVVDEIYNQAGMPDYVGFWKTAGFRYFLTVPLRIGGSIIGFINFHIENREAINPKSILVKSVCDQIAVAVSNILANEKIREREEEKSRLLEFSNAMASVRDKQVLGKILKNQLNDLFGIEDYVIHSLSSDKKTHRPLLYDPEADFAHHPDFLKLTETDNDVNDGVFNKILAAEDLVTFNVEDWHNSTDPPTYSNAAKSVGLKSMAGISLRLESETIAIMNFRRDGINDFSIERPLFKSICSQIAIAISNILASEEIVKSEEQKTILLSLSNEIATVRSRKDLFHIVNTKLKKLFSINEFAIAKIDEGGQTYSAFVWDLADKTKNHLDFSKLISGKYSVSDPVFSNLMNSEDPVLVLVNDLVKEPEIPTYVTFWKNIGLRNVLCVPLCVGGKMIGSAFLYIDANPTINTKSILLKGVCAQLAVVVSNILASEKVLNQLEEINKYKQQLENEKTYLKEEIEISQNYSEIIGESQEMKKVFRMVTQVAPSDSTVLLLGETGTGKELIARAIHNASPRKNKLMIKINCAALPANLIESELFGHERGSFTGAFDRRIGKFELANNGTLFLDEIGEMPLELQVKLLRALQEKEIERIGGKTTIKTDVRIIAATNRDLEKLMEEGKFRIDLYYRLNIFPIQLPPLRKRHEDIPQLASHFLLRFCKKAGKKISNFSNKALEQLQQHDWPGNIRELEHLIERSVLLTAGDTIKEFDLPNKKSRSVTEVKPENLKIQTIFENEKEYILKILKHVDGRIAGEGGAAEILGIPPSTLNSRIKKLGIRKEHRG